MLHYYLKQRRINHYIQMQEKIYLTLRYFWSLRSFVFCWYFYAGFVSFLISFSSLSSSVESLTSLSSLNIPSRTRPSLWSKCKYWFLPPSRTWTWPGHSSLVAISHGKCCKCPSLRYKVWDRMRHSHILPIILWRYHMERLFFMCTSKFAALKKRVST